MYTGLKHLHLLLITLFLITTLIKTILLFVNEEKFDKYRAKMKMPDMLVTMLFLVTGIIMFTIRGGGFHFLMHIKLTIILIAIPLAIVGFKKKKKALVIFATSFFIITYGVAEMSNKKVKEKHVDLPVTDVDFGKKLYEANCVTCHGDGGASQINGAADLSLGDFSLPAVSSAILKGSVSKKMPAFKTLDSTEVNAISAYVLTLKAQ